LGTVFAIKNKQNTLRKRFCCGKYWVFGQALSRIRLYVDGASLSNPGPSSVGVFLFDQDWDEVEQFSEVIGNATCNVAEYQAVITGLDIAAKHTRQVVECYTDSDIVEGQLSGRYRLKNDNLRGMFHKVKDKERPFSQVIYCKTRRNDQRLALAHQLAHDALNGRAKIHARVF